jgi:hypothetical protein
MLPTERGASIATTCGDGSASAPTGAGPQRVKALEVPGAARFSVPCADAPMRMGPPALGAQMAGTFSLFLLPEGCPWRFAPALEDPAAAEGSMVQGRCLRSKSSAGRRQVECQGHRGSGI